VLRVSQIGLVCTALTSCQWGSLGAFVRQLWLALGLIACHGAEVQWQIDTWNVESGLPNNTVTALAQSQDGFLWVGTDNGLARFDGQQFRVFSPQNTPVLGGGQVRALCGDEAGCLWVSTAQAGPICLSPGRAPSVVPGNSSDPAPVIALATDSTGVLWWATQNGVAGRLDERTLRSIVTNIPGAESSLRLFRGATGKVYAATSRGLARLCRNNSERAVEVTGGTLRLPSRVTRVGGSAPAPR
jgi:ligand-binding sensor domain-containing protein